jgi:lipid-A-disaccharide synthase
LVESKLRIGMVAGEASGDILGIGLMRALRRLCPDVSFEGIGGPRMVSEGFNTLAPMERLSVMGFVEPLGRLPELLRIKKALQNHFFANPPDVFVGIDSPGFNIRLEQALHDHGIRTVHYVSPSVWAWGQKRIHKIATATDLVLALLPFESAFYEAHQVAVRFVGHPLADAIAPEAGNEQDKRAARVALGLAPEQTLIALMPGSRRDEINRLGPVFLDTAKRCLERDKQLEFLIPCANTERKVQIEALLAGHDAAASCHVFEGQSHQAMLAADAILLASGTATLEAMLFKRPMVVCYRLSPLTYALASRMLKVPYVSLPNLLAGERLVPEFLQNDVTVANLSTALQSLIGNEAKRTLLTQRFAAIHQHIRCNADEQAARAVLALASGRPGQGD